MPEDNAAVVISPELTQVTVTPAQTIVSVPVAETTITIADQANSVTSKVLSLNIGDRIDEITATVVPEPTIMSFSGILTAYYVVGDDPVGDIVINLYKTDFNTFNPPITYGSSICGSNKITLSGSSKNSDTTLTGWTTSFNEGDVLSAVVESASLHSRVRVVLKFYVVGQ